MRVDALTVETYDDGRALGAAAAAAVAPVLREELKLRGEASLIVATGNSQLAFMQALGLTEDLDWDWISIFHMDEYIGMPESHPASFRRYIREKLVDRVAPRAFFGIDGDAADLSDEINRYSKLLREHKPVACVMGIGENGHLAFNDPPADFQTSATVHVVDLDDACRRQQVGEGHFKSMADVPRQALSLTVPALLRPRHVFVVVPEMRKAQAVRAALRGPITPTCPASILRTCSHARLFLDADSASLL